MRYTPLPQFKAGDSWHYSKYTPLPYFKAGYCWLTSMHSLRHLPTQTSMKTIGWIVFHDILYYIILYCIVLHRTTLYRTTLYCILHVYIYIYIYIICIYPDGAVYEPRWLNSCSAAPFIITIVIIIIIIIIIINGIIIITLVSPLRRRSRPRAPSV